MWQDLLALANAQLEEMPVVDRLEGLRPEVVRWRPVSTGSQFFSPVPLIARLHLSDAGRWLEEEPLAGEWVGLDARDRPVLVELRSPVEGTVPKRGWIYDDGDLRFELDAVRSAVHAWDPLPPTGEAWCASRGRTVGGITDVRRLRIADGVVWRVEGARQVSLLSPAIHARQLAAGRDHGPPIILGSSSEPDLAQIDASADDLPGALETATTVEPDQIAWDGRLLVRESWTPDLPGRVSELLASCVAAIDRAIRDARDLVWIDIDMSTDHHHPVALPPTVRLVDEDHLRQVTADPDNEGLDLLAAASSLAPPIPLVDELDADVLRMFRAISQVARDVDREDVHAAAHSMIEQLADGLASALPADSGVVTFAFTSGPESTADALRRARTHSGTDSVDLLLSRIGAI